MSTATKKNIPECADPTKREEKKGIIQVHGKHKKDTGSTPVQIAILTERIAYLTGHLKAHPKDDHGRRGLMQAVVKRRKLLSYLENQSSTEYQSLIKTLGLRH